MNFIFEIVYLLSDFVNLFKRIAIKVYALCIWGIEKDECKPTYAHHSTQPMQEHIFIGKEYSFLENIDPLINSLFKRSILGCGFDLLRPSNKYVRVTKVVADHGFEFSGV